MLIKRFPKSTREKLSLSIVFDPTRQPTSSFEVAKQDRNVEKLVEMYAPSLSINPILLRAQFKKFHRSMRTHSTKDSFEKFINSRLTMDSKWCKEVLQVRSRLRAPSHATADTGRMFSLMNRIKGKLSSRIGKSLGHRMLVQAHIAKDPELIDWEYAYSLWIEKKKRYAVKMKGSKKLRMRKKLRGLQISLLNM